MNYPINANDFIRAYETATGSALDEQCKEMARAVIGVKNRAYAEGFSAGKEAARHE